MRGTSGGIPSRDVVLTPVVVAAACAVSSPATAGADPAGRCERACCRPEARQFARARAPYVTDSADSRAIAFQSMRSGT